MTNNPTIDGVSRESVLQLVDFLADAKAYHKVVIGRCNDCIKSGESSEREEYGRKGFRTQKIAQVEQLSEELRALLDSPVEPFSLEGWGIDHSAGRPILVHNKCSVIEAEQAYGLFELINAAKDAPVVERQLVEVPVVGKLVPNGGGYDCWHPAANQGQAVVLQSDHAEYVAALQSTIAQLQARVQGLESGRGEPVAWEVYWTDEDEFYKITRSKEFVDKRLTDTDFRFVPLFTFPSAPVAVVLPECKSDSGREWDSHYVAEVEGWNACLDATDALNKSP